MGTWKESICLCYKRSIRSRADRFDKRFSSYEDERKTWGHSIVVCPWGQVLACKPDTDPGIVLADIDLSEVHKVRQQIPNLKLEQPFEMTQVKAV